MIGKCVLPGSSFAILSLHVPELECSVMDIRSGIFFLLFGSLLVGQVLGPVFFKPLLGRTHLIVCDLLTFDESLQCREEL